MTDKRADQLFHLKKVVELQNDIDNAQFYGVIEITIRNGKLVLKRTVRTEVIEDAK